MNLFGILEYHQGCGDAIGCFGPVDDYYTLFDRELRFLYTPIIISVFIGIIVFILLYKLKRKEKLNIHPIISFVIAVGIALLCLYIAINYFHAGMVLY